MHSGALGLPKSTLHTPATLKSRHQVAEGVHHTNAIPPHDTHFHLPNGTPHYCPHNISHLLYTPPQQVSLHWHYNRCQPNTGPMPSSPGYTQSCHFHTLYPHLPIATALHHSNQTTNPYTPQRYPHHLQYTCPNYCPLRYRPRSLTIHSGLPEKLARHPYPGRDTDSDGCPPDLCGFQPPPPHHHHT